jgi:hypothetical protein
MSEKFMGYVTNNYSKGMVQVQLFGQHDGAQEKMKWAFVDQGTNNLAVAGVGQAHGLQPGCRVQCTQMGGKDGSIIASGAMDRWGSGQGGGGLGSSQEDSTTHYPAVNKAQGDYCIPCQNENSENGTRVEAKAPDGRYNPYAGGQPLDLSNSKFPTTQYKDA